MSIPPAILRRTAVVSMALLGAAASAQEKIYSAAQITEQAVVEALQPRASDADAGGSVADAHSRGFKLVRPQASVRKLPMMLTFLTDSADLLPQTKAVLDRVAKGLKSDKLATVTFVVEGHADPRGSQDHNLKLSQDRAESVLKYLVSQHGVSPDRLKAVGKGTSELLNKDQPTAPENRRVSIVARD